MSKIEYLPQEKVKDVLVTRTAIKTLTSENTVERIVSFQFKDISLATKKYDEIEISGFGILMLSPSKLRRKIKEYERILANIAKILETTTRIEEYTKKLESVQKGLDYLKSRQ